MRARGRLGSAATAGIALAAVGVAIRVNNALRYPTNWGFDARFNWEYIEHLMSAWTLPAPGELWASSHPPLFYYLGAGLGRLLGTPGTEGTVLAIRLLSSAAGLGSVALAVLLVRRLAPGCDRRVGLAAGALLFLPVHIYMSAMLNEEMLAASLTSLALTGTVFALARPLPDRRESWRAAAIGLVGGLALLTKLSGAIVVLTSAAAYAAGGLARRRLRPAALHVTLVIGCAGLAGGWFYARNQLRYGYLYPHGLETHRIMRSMPPGERQVADYLRVPPATWTDPQLLAPGLLRSVWGSTYVTVFFDGHRTFVPREGSGIQRAGRALLVLGLLPSVAFIVGLGRGARRSLRTPAGPDLPLLLIVALTLGGYVLFTWRNPWFVAVKGSYLLGLSLPFAYYSSEVLADWTRGRGARSHLVLAALALAAGLSAATFSYGTLFAKWEMPGLEWRTG
ncbi:MAG: hypothetical protein ACE5FG_12555 [Myxococcota bacterium]